MPYQRVYNTGPATVLYYEQMGVYVAGSCGMFRGHWFSLLTMARSIEALVSVGDYSQIPSQPLFFYGNEIKLLKVNLMKQNHS